MTSLLNRLERLERETPEMRQRFIWVDRGETTEQALHRAGSLAPDESPLFVRWDWGTEMAGA